MNEGAREGGSQETNWPIIDLICGPAEFDRCPDQSDQSDSAVGRSIAGKALEKRGNQNLCRGWLTDGLGKYWLF